jgi:heme-degrading monooxygenase HmoA
MYAIAVAAQVQPHKADEAAAIFRDSVVPAYRELDGFQSALLLIDPATGKSLGISLWDTEAHRNAIQSSGALQQQIARFASVLVAQPVPNTYEVRVQT